MKAILGLLMAAFCLADARAQDAPGVGDGVVVLPVGKLPKEAPLFFSVTAEVEAHATLKEVTAFHQLTFRVHQGKPEVLSVALTGKGEVKAVIGEGIRDWAVRVAEDGSRYLDIRPTLAEARWEWAVRAETHSSVEEGNVAILLPGRGTASGFSLGVTVRKDSGLELGLAKVEGLAEVAGREGEKFVGTGPAVLEMRVSEAGPGSRGARVLDASLVGRLAPDGNSVSFLLRGRVSSASQGGRVELMSGGVALSSGVAGDGWHVELRKSGQLEFHDLVAGRAGEFPIEIGFEVPVKRRGDWRSLDFQVPGGVIVPVRIEGLAEGVTFDRGQAVVPVWQQGTWGGFLPANGAGAMAWRVADVTADGALFFSSTEITDVRVGSGLLRQSTRMNLRVLQGELAALALAIDGPGEVLAVKGTAVLGWSVRETAGKRVLDVRLNQPIKGSGEISIEAQSVLGGFPVKAAALRLVPDGALRHSGWLRVANEGAVRIEVADSQGLIQLAPAQFPGQVTAEARQMFVFRFPAAEYAYAILADQVLPEVAVSEVTIYELAETDRRIFTDVELDIREAPLREWEMEIPADYAVASVSGAIVADYVAAGDVVEGRRRLKVIFQQPVIDRQLLRVRLEKNEAAKAGDWTLPPLGFPGAKSHRGYAGAVGAAGYRLTSGTTTGVAEVPLTFFPKKTAGLQQAFRLKEGAWSVALKIEALGQSVQADVFHLYSLKAGAAYGSVLVNYFVVGSPSTEWRIQVPEGIGNIDVTGQNVGRDWRREGNVVIVPLYRPLLGAGTVLLTFEQPMSGRGGEISPGEVRPLNVQGERGYVQVVSPLQVNHEVIRNDGALLTLDPSELPAEFRLLSSAPTLAAWQYTSRDFSIGVKIEWYEPGETVTQVVDFMKLSSRVAKDGQWVTDARFFVKSRNRSALRVKLPPGSLWEARVGGEAVNARQDGGETLVPLPARGDPNQAVEVSLRYGVKAGDPSNLRLAAPVISAPVVIGEWTVSADEGRQLVPRGGTATLGRPALAATGWEWIGGRTGWVALLAALILVLVASRRTGAAGWIGVARVLLGLGIAFGAAVVTLKAMESGARHASILEYDAPVVAAGEGIEVVVGNVPAWQARFGWQVWTLLSLAVGTLVAGWWWKSPVVRWLGLVLAIAAVLSVRGISAPLFGLLAIGAMAWALGRILRWIRGAITRPVSHAVAGLALAGLLGWSGQADAAPVKTAESMIHDWSIRNGRLSGMVDVTVRGEAGDRFLLLRQPAVLASFTGEGVEVVKAPVEGGEGYFLQLAAAGRFTGQARFEMDAAAPENGWLMPGGPAVMRTVTVRWDRPGWEFASSRAARVSPVEGLAPSESGATLVLGATDPVVITARPRQRNAGAEEVKFFAEVANLFLPGPGVVGGKHRISIRPAQGRLSSVLMRVPEGFTVGDVTDGPVESWRYDPGKRELRVALEPSQEQAFTFLVETQRGAGTFPAEIEVEPLRVLGAAGDVGMLALGFGDEAQPETVVTDGLSRVNPGDFDGGLVEGEKKERSLSQASLVIQHVFRYGAAVAKARVKVAAVAPELRAESWQLVSLGEDRLLVSTDLTVNITRAGVFRLALAVPEGLEIESVTGAGLSHWSESGTGAERTLNLHLAGKTLGIRKFSITLGGAASTASASWAVPRISLKGASRETGLLTVVPERGLQVRAVDRRNVSQADPRELAGGNEEAAKAAARPGALAYRLLQGDWALSLAIGKLDPWITAKVYHEATLREGQLLARIALRYRIENAAVKSLRVRIPGLDAESAATVRATGPAIADLVPVAGEEGTWEIRFQRGIAGEKAVDLEYQRRGTDAAAERIDPVVPVAARQVEYFAAVRSGGRLEIEAGVVPRGWQRADWTVVQAALGDAAGGVAPMLSFRVTEPEGPLPVVLKRHELAGLRKLRVSEGTLTTLVSPHGDALTAVALKLDVAGKGTLRLRLPANARLFQVRVNEAGANLVREGRDWLFHVFPSPQDGKPATVDFVYSCGTAKGTRLEGPSLDVPMENLSWRVLVPEGWELVTRGGDFDLKDSTITGVFRLEDYRSLVSFKRESDSRSAVAMLDQANAWLKAGDQERAGMALGNAVKSNLLDDASNEDARVQLRQLKTQQAVLGLNTRRQKLVLDNLGDAPDAVNKQVELAAGNNPVLRGLSNFDPKEYDRLMEGNSAEENAALKEIASRIVSQQLASEPAPVALDVTLPERGTILTFGRSVQVDGGASMVIPVKLRKEGAGGFWSGGILCGALAAVLGGSLIKRR